MKSRRSIVLDFTKTKKFGREKGKHSTVYHCYFFIVWILKDSLLDAFKKNRELGMRDGQKYNPN